MSSSMSASPSSGIRPRAAVTAPPPRAPVAKPLPPAPSWPPTGSDSLGRVKTAQGLAYLCTCGCGVPVLEDDTVVPPFEVMRERQEGRVGPLDLWRHAFSPRCARRPAFSLMETADRAFEAENSRFRLGPTHPGEQPVRHTGKTERERQKRLAKRAEAAEQKAAPPRAQDSSKKGKEGDGKKKGGDSKKKNR